MQTTNAIQAASPFTPANSSVVARTWQAGTLLQAPVIAPEGLVTLCVGNISLTEKSLIPLQQDQPLQPQVMEAGANPVLKIIHNTVSCSPDAQQITGALRTCLPRQAPLPQLLARLAPLVDPVPADQRITDAYRGTQPRSVTQ